MAKKAKDKGVEPSQKMRQLSELGGFSDLGEIVIYNPVDTIKIDVHLDRETVWLTQQQLSVLFGVDRTVIVRHIGNIYRSKELDKASTGAKNAQVQNAGGRRSGC